MRVVARGTAKLQLARIRTNGADAARAPVGIFSWMSEDPRGLSSSIRILEVRSGRPPMLFNSPDFAVFIAVVLPLFYALRSRWRLQNVLLLTAGYVFYGWWDWRFPLVAGCFDGGRLHGGPDHWRVGEWTRGSQGDMVFVLCFNLSLLGVFKYFNFFAESFAAATQSLFHWHPNWTP